MNPNNTFLEKYRPKDLSGVVGNPLILKILQNFIKREEFPHLLFHGQPGTGKTTCAMNLARLICGSFPSPNVLELNASDERGIQTIREKVKTFVSTSFNILKFTKKSTIKLVILDEADSMTNAAQFALRRLIELYSKTVRFILICNDVFSIIPALKSRCVALRFKPIMKDEVRELLKKICISEQADVSDAALEYITDTYKGDLRKPISLLQIKIYKKLDSISYTEIDITENNKLKNKKNLEGDKNKSNICDVENKEKRFVKEWFDKLSSNSIQKSYEELYKIVTDEGVTVSEIMEILLDIIFKVNNTNSNSEVNNEKWKGGKELENLRKIECAVIELGEINSVQVYALVAASRKLERALNK